MPFGPPGPTLLVKKMHPRMGLEALGVHFCNTSGEEDASNEMVVHAIERSEPFGLYIFDVKKKDAECGCIFFTRGVGPIPSTPFHFFFTRGVALPHGLQDEQRTKKMKRVGTRGKANFTSGVTNRSTRLADSVVMHMHTIEDRRRVCIENAQRSLRRCKEKGKRGTE